MHPRTKLVSAAVVLIVGLMAAGLFRRVEPLPPPPRKPSALVLPRRPSLPISPADRHPGNPVVRLLGRIMPVEESLARSVSLQRTKAETSTDASLQFTEPPELLPNPRRLPSGELIYTVEPADTLRGLAYRFLGSAEQWPLLASVNHNVIGDAERLSPGTELRIPRSLDGPFPEAEPTVDDRPMMPISRPRPVGPLFPR